MKKHVMPADPESRFKFILKVVFGNSPSALAKAAGVSRTAVYKWPPDQIWLLDTHLAKALDSAIADTVERHRMLVDLKTKLLERMFGNTEKGD